LRTGILALQGGFHEHAESLKLINQDYLFVRNPEDINNIDSIILPGGETTAMIKIQETNTLFQNIKEFIQSGAPTLGTCAGLILLSKQTILGRNTLNVIDSEVERNSYGRQNQSFEALVKFKDFTGNYCFIRAPKILNYEGSVEPIAYLDEEIVGIKHENIIGLTFHPELTNYNHYLNWLNIFLKKGSNVGTF
jgi:5'-phosphate synthase pdxT subunit